jgi:hypothetical protein
MSEETAGPPQPLSLRERRDRGLTDLAATIEAIWGPRCNRHEAGCFACVAWTMFDTMEKLTDSSVLDEESQG